MNDRPEIRCYALRRLNPFLGVLQVIETSRGRASTSNGLVWHIELLADQLTGWGSLDCDSEEQVWYLYAIWSEKDGLVDLPTAEISKCRQAAEISEQIVEAVKANQPRLPFPLADRRELWLRDAEEKKPLALLFALQPDAPAPSPEPRYWRGCLGRRGVSGQRRFPQIDRLEAEVRKRAGFNIKRLWVDRDYKCANTGVPGGKQFCDNDFPIYGIREDWSDETVAALVQRYIDWTAPSLLILPSLEDSRRARLESRLERQARSIEYHWRLYPKILDANKITAARVRDLEKIKVHALLV